MASETSELYSPPTEKYTRIPVIDDHIPKDWKNGVRTVRISVYSPAEAGVNLYTSSPMVSGTTSPGSLVEEGNQLDVAA